jgi:hypothetical protein
MTPPTVSAALAAEHIRDLERAAARRTPVVLVHRDRTPVWERAAGSARALAAGTRSVAAGTREWFRRGQLGPTADNCVTC